MNDYERIASAIRFLSGHVTEQPTLAALAAHLNLSPFHLQRLFTRWAGTSPKRFLQVVTLELGKQLLDDGWSVQTTSDALGLSSPSRLYDHFVQLEGVTPGEYRSGGNGIRIDHGICETPYGPLFLATTPRGICMAGFIDAMSEQPALESLKRQWPGASLHQDSARCEALAARIVDAPGPQQNRALTLHVRGTNFQLAVWRALLSVPPGTAVSYGQLATAVGQPGASRAVGSAVGANPVALLIPCHRVIRQSGALGGYRWQPERKLAIQAREKLLLTPETVSATKPSRGYQEAVTPPGN